jgi:PAS domain S-box-containing protein
MSSIYDTEVDHTSPSDIGEMQRRCEELDWSRTPLGPAEEWSSALRTAVETCLASRFPMLLCWGPELAMVYNDAYRPILGRTKHPMALGRPTKEVWPEVWGIVGPGLEDILVGGEPTWSEDQMLVVDRNGFLEECYFTFSFSPVRVDSGAVGGVLCVVTETTERVLGERRLGTLTGLSNGLGGVEDVESLRSVASRVLHRNGLDHPFAAVVLRPGVDEGTAPGPVEVSPDSRGLADTPPQLRADVAALAQEALRTGQLVRRNVDADPWVPGEDYTIPVGALCAIPVWLPGQEAPEGALVIGRSAHRPWDESLEAYLNLCTIQLRTAFVALRSRVQQQRRTDALTALDEAKSAFFTNISHELRTPLTLISGAVDQTLSDEGLTDLQRSRLEIIDRNATRLARMVDAMLDFDRMEAGRLSPDLTEIDVVEMTRGLAAAFLPAMERAGLELDIDCEPQSRRAVLDRDMFERIVLNLLMNAVKYTPVGRVSVRLRGDDAGFTVSVSDTGIGIPRVDLDRVFERFEQLPRRSMARSHEGAGIGLAMVKQLTELMGGRVAATSELGVGSEFSVSLPWRAPFTPGLSRSVTPRHVGAFLAETDGWQVEDRLEPHHRLDEGDGAAATARGRPRLVIADDNADMRAYLRDLLSTTYDVELAPDGIAALEAIRSDRPDLVLADVMMPRMDGFELVRAIREDGSLADLPIILLSARAEERDTTQGLESGADDYLVKPFSVEELRARLASNLERSRARLRDAAWRRAVMASFTDALVITDESGRIIEFNEAFTDLLGWELDEGPFQPPYPWWPTDGEQSEADDPWLPAERGAASSGSVEQQLRLVTKDGREVWVVTRSQRVNGVGDGRALLVVTLRDVTREHRARERRRAAALLSSEFSASGDLAQVLTTAVTGFAELFDGDSTVRAFAGTEEHLFTAHGPVRHGDIEATIREALNAESPEVPSLSVPVTGLLLVPENPNSECRVWIQFQRPRLVPADELIVGDLLAQAFALAVDRVVAADDFAEREDHLAKAIQSHRMIGQAIGILIERHRISPTQAFGMLKQASQERNIKLREIAARVIETGAEPTEAE